jgi:hypothetical protein
LRSRSRRSALVADAEATPPPPNLEPARFCCGQHVVVGTVGRGAYLVIHGVVAEVELMRMVGDLFARCSLLHSRTDSGEWNGYSSTMANPDFHIEKLRQHACHHVTRRSFAIEFAVELGGLLEMALQIKAFMYSVLIELSS